MRESLKEPGQPYENYDYKPPTITEEHHITQQQPQEQNHYLTVENNQPMQNFNENFENKSEDNIYSPDKIEQNMRLGFIRKVYGVLCSQLIFTALLSSIGFLNSVRAYYYSTMWLFWFAFAITIVTCFALACFKSLAKSVPVNYILLFLFTAGESIMLSYLFAAINDVKIVVIAAVATVVVCSALTIYACTTKTDFTYLGGLLFVCLSLMFVLGLFYIWYPQFLRLLYCFLGLVLFSIYLIFDTQLVMGKYGLEYEIDDYIIAALNIYMDIIQIFIYILSILSRR